MIDKRHPNQAVHVTKALHAYAEELKDRGYSKSTIQIYKMRLRGFLNYAPTKLYRNISITNAVSYLDHIKPDTGLMNLKQHRTAIIYFYDVFTKHDPSEIRTAVLEKTHGLVNPLKGEVWKPVYLEGYEDFYQISNLGRVKSTPRMITTKAGQKRYISENLIAIRWLGKENHKAPCVGLASGIENKHTTAYLSTLLGHAFVHNPDPKNLTMACYKDYNRENSVATNIIWKSQSEVTIDNMKRYPEIKQTLYNSNVKSGRCVSKEVHKKIELLIKENVSIKAIAITLDLSHGTVHYHINKLNEQQA